MNSKASIALVATVAVILVLVGTFLYDRNNEEQSLEGTYVFHSGTFATIDDEGNVKYTEITKSNDLVIKSLGYDLYTATRGERILTGTAMNGTINFSTQVIVGENTFVGYASAYAKNGIIYLSSICFDKDGTYFATNHVFIKKGLERTPSEFSPIIDIGTEFNAYHSENIVKGKLTDITSTSELKMKVVGATNGIYALKVHYEYGEIVSDKTYLAIQNSKFSLVSGYDSMGLADTIVSDKKHISVLKSMGLYSHAAFFSMMSSDDTKIEPSALPKISGNVYCGSYDSTDSTGFVKNRYASLAFGDVVGGTFNTAANYFDYITGVASSFVIPVGNEGYVFFSNFEYEGIWTTFNKGFISKDLKKMTVLDTTLYLDGSIYSGKLNLTLANKDDSLIGYYNALTSDTIYNSGKSSHDDKENPYGYNLVIDSVVGDIVKGTHNGYGFVGAMKDGILKFEIYGYNNGWFNCIVTIQFVDNGFIAYTLYSNTSQDFNACSIATFAKSGSGVAPETPHFQNTFSENEKFYCFLYEYLLDETKFTGSTDGSLECLYSKNGLYRFAFKYEGEEIILTGYQSGDGSAMLTHSGGGTFSANKYDGFIDFSRTICNSNGVQYAYYMLMSVDGEKPELPEIPAFKGNKYSCVLKYGSTTDRKFETGTLGMTINIVDQYDSLLRITDGYGTYNAHIRNISDGVFGINYTAYLTNSGSEHQFDVWGYISDDGKHITLVGATSHNGNISFVIECTLTE